MIVFFNKKRILTVTICLVLSFFLAGIREKNETIETVALPVEDKVIIIDAGHGLPDEGGRLLKLNNWSKNSCNVYKKKTYKSFRPFII